MIVSTMADNVIGLCLRGKILGAFSSIDLDVFRRSGLTSKGVQTNYLHQH